MSSRKLLVRLVRIELTLLRLKVECFTPKLQTQILPFSRLTQRQAFTDSP